ncbi:MAG: hypothetical protein ACXWTP_05915 [Methylosarcina sp.]
MKAPLAFFILPWGQLQRNSSLHLFCEDRASAAPLVMIHADPNLSLYAKTGSIANKN